MEFLPKDKNVQMGLLVVSALLVILVLKNSEKSIGTNISNLLIAVVILAAIYFGLQMTDNQENFYQDDESEINSLDDEDEDIFPEDPLESPNVPPAPPIVPRDVPPSPRVVPPEPPVVPPVVPRDVPPVPPVVPPVPPVVPPSPRDVPPVPPSANNARPQPFDMSNDTNALVDELDAVKEDSGCYPKDILSPEDLLPKDLNTTWQQASPSTSGSLESKNFVNAGFHIGVNTVGQSLRNANRQLRSDPPNPQVKVSPWMQSTIEPDINRKPLEIGA